MEGRPVEWTVDGIRIAGQLRLPDAGGPAAGLCLCHGIPSGKPADPGDPGYPGLAERFCRAGFATLIFSFRGTGASGGNLDMPGWTRDLSRAIDFLCSCSGVDASRIYLMGFSGGAAASAWVTAHDLRVAGLVLCACPARFGRVVAGRKADFSVERFREIGLIRDEGFPASAEDWMRGFAQVDPIDWIDRVSPRPLLMIHGQDDDLIDEEQARRLFEKAGQPKEIAVVAGAGHRLRLSRPAMDLALDWLKKLQPADG